MNHLEFLISFRCSGLLVKKVKLVIQKWLRNYMNLEDLDNMKTEESGKETISIPMDVKKWTITSKSKSLIYHDEEKKKTILL